jgi:hypothetical protein
MIVRASYTRSPEAAKSQLFAITTKPDQHGQAHNHQPFDGVAAVSTQDVYGLIEHAQPKSYFYHLMLSPDPGTEDVRRDLHLRAVTEAAMVDLGEHIRQPFPWAAVAHADHARCRHIHVLAILRRRLDRAALALLRESASQECRFQREGLDTGEGKGGADPS